MVSTPVLALDDRGKRLAELRPILPSPTTAAMTTTVAGAAMAATPATTAIVTMASSAAMMTATAVTAIRMTMTLAAVPASMTAVLTFVAAPLAATCVIYDEVAVSAEAPCIIDSWTLLIATAANAAQRADLVVSMLPDEGIISRPVKHLAAVVSIQIEVQRLASTRTEEIWSFQC